MLSDLLRWGGKRPRQPDASGERLASRAETSPDAVQGISEVAGGVAAQPDPPVLLDLGPVIGSNVEFFGERLGCKLFIEDLFADFDRHSRAGTLDDLPRHSTPASGTPTAAWTASCAGTCFDFLPKAAAQSLARQIIRMLRPGGAVMGFFSTAAARHAGFTKYEIVDDNLLRHRQHAGAGGSKHVLANRDIIRMFEGLIVSDSFLLKNNTREILLRRKS